MKRAIIILGHGSRHAGTKDAIAKLAAEVRKSASDQIIEYAFLQYLQPTLREALALCIGQHADTITIVPFFLHPGAHVMEDVPAQVEQVKRQHPGVAVNVTDFVGSHPLMAAIVLDLVKGKA